jgi:hypothetical protein
MPTKKDSGRRSQQRPAAQRGPMAETPRLPARANASSAGATDSVDAAPPDHRNRRLMGRAIAEAALGHFPKGRCPYSNDLEALAAAFVGALGRFDDGLWDHAAFKLTASDSIRSSLMVAFGHPIRELSAIDAAFDDLKFSSVAWTAIAEAVAAAVQPLGLRELPAYMRPTVLSMNTTTAATYVDGGSTVYWKEEMDRHAHFRRLDYISTAGMEMPLQAVAKARLFVALFTGPSGSGKSLTLMLLAHDLVVGHVSFVVYFVANPDLIAMFNEAVQVERTSGMDAEVAECRALYTLFARRAKALPSNSARDTDTIVFAIDDIGDQPQLLRAFRRAAFTEFTLPGLPAANGGSSDSDGRAPASTKKKRLGAHLSALLNGASIRFAAAGTGIGATAVLRVGSHPESFKCVAIHVPYLFSHLMFSLRNVPDHIRTLLCPGASWTAAGHLPTASESKEASQLLALVENARCAAIAASTLADLFPTPDAIAPPECSTLLAHLQRTIALGFKGLTGLKELSVDEYVAASTLAMAAAVSDHVDPLRKLDGMQPRLAGNGNRASLPHALPRVLMMMLRDNATSDGTPAEEIPGSRSASATGDALFLGFAQSSGSRPAAFEGRRRDPRFIMEPAQVIVAGAVCDGRPSHLQFSNGFEAAMVDACLRLVRLMHPVPRAMLRSEVADPRVKPGDPLPFVSFDRFVRVLASRIGDVGSKPVRVAQLPHPFTKCTPCGLPESAKSPHTGFTTRSFKALMHVARGDLREDDAHPDEFERVLRDDTVFGSHYVLKNAPRASGPDIVVIMQGATPGAFTVIFLQCKFCSSESSLQTNTSKATIESELAKSLERRAELKTPAGNDTPVEPYFAIVQQCVPLCGSYESPSSRDEAVYARLHREAFTKVNAGSGETVVVPSNVVRSNEVHAEFATPGVWFVSASEPSPLLPGLSGAAGIASGADYSACKL